MINNNEDRFSKVNDLFNELDNYNSDFFDDNEKKQEEPEENVDLNPSYENITETPLESKESYQDFREETLSHDIDMEQTRNISSATINTDDNFDLKQALEEISKKPNLNEKDRNLVNHFLETMEAKKPEQENIQEGNKQKTLTKKDEITSAFINVSVLAFSTAAIGGGWIAYIISQL